MEEERIQEGKKMNKKEQGKKNRRDGAAFELKVRKSLEEEGYIVDKWTNNVDLELKKIVKAKTKFMFGRPVGLGSGFPDFIAFRFSPFFVEVKSNGKLTKIEKEKCEFIRCLGYRVQIASKDGKGIKYTSI